MMKFIVKPKRRKRITSLLSVFPEEGGTLQYYTRNNLYYKLDFIKNSYIKIFISETTSFIEQGQLVDTLIYELTNDQRAITPKEFSTNLTIAINRMKSNA